MKLVDWAKIPWSPKCFFYNFRDDHHTLKNPILILIPLTLYFKKLSLHYLWNFTVKFPKYTVKKSIKESFSTVFEPPHDKTDKMACAPTKTQISQGMCPVWSESSLSAWRKLGSLATYWVHSEDSDSLGTHATLLVLSRGGSFLSYQD